MRTSSVIVLTPPGADAAVAIAACRAGARGFLDLEHAPRPAHVEPSLQRLQRFTSACYGVRVGRDGDELISYLLQAGGSRLAWVILAGGEHARLARWVDLLQQNEICVLLEAVSLTEVALAERVEADGVVLKGNEAGGRIGPETTAVLAQLWRRYVAGQPRRLPAWLHGGVTPETAREFLTRGAAGIVLDAQLLLAREACLAEPLRHRLLGIEAGRTVVVGERAGECYRLAADSSPAALQELAAEEGRLAQAALTPAERLAAWRKALVRHIVAGPEKGVWPLAQDAALAAPLARHFCTVAGIVHAVALGTAADLPAESPPLPKPCDVAVIGLAQQRTDARAAIHQALADAGYAERPFARERTALIAAAGLNVLASDEFHFGAANYAVEAGEGSGLAAIHSSVRELETGSADLALACGPFHDGHGLGALALKRLTDAERDGDRIYAVVRGIGASRGGDDEQTAAGSQAHAQARTSPSAVSWCALGVAGLLDTVLHLHRQSLPAAPGQAPSSPAESASHLPTRPRTASVAVHAQGGMHFHLVLAEYTGGYLPDASRFETDCPLCSVQPTVVVRT